MTTSSLRIRRVIWKHPPAEEVRRVVEDATLFGPSWYERGNEWLFVYKMDGYLHGATPEGFVRLN